VLGLAQDSSNNLFCFSDFFLPLWIEMGGGRKVAVIVGAHFFLLLWHISSSPVRTLRETVIQFSDALCMSLEVAHLVLCVRGYIGNVAVYENPLDASMGISGPCKSTVYERLERCEIISIAPLPCAFHPPACPTAETVADRKHLLRMSVLLLMNTDGTTTR
jgi:hypothetical protein